MSQSVDVLTAYLSREEGAVLRSLAARQRANRAALAALVAEARQRCPDEAQLRYTDEESARSKRINRERRSIECALARLVRFDGGIGLWLLSAAERMESLPESEPAEPTTAPTPDAATLAGASA